MDRHATGFRPRSRTGHRRTGLECILDIGHSRYLGGWYGGKDLTGAKKVAIPKTGSKTVTFTVG
jgi:hypothetical protein